MKHLLKILDISSVDIAKIANVSRQAVSLALKKDTAPSSEIQSAIDILLLNARLNSVALDNVKQALNELHNFLK